MSSRAETQHEIVVNAPAAFVFDRITDHEAMAAWPGVSKCRLVEQGSPRNGLGAVREITALGLKLQERVVRFEPGKAYEYTIIKGLPVDHLGRVDVIDEGGTTRVKWRITMSSGIPLLARGTVAALGIGMPRALKFFKQDTEKRHGRTA